VPRTFKQILDDCNDLKIRKQARYKRSDDDLSAFEYTASQANIPVPNQIFAKIIDKEGRLANYFKDSELDIEGMLEECEDIINYHAFMIMSLERMYKSPSKDPFKREATQGRS